MSFYGLHFIIVIWMCDVIVCGGMNLGSLVYMGLYKYVLIGCVVVLYNICLVG